MFFLGWSCNTQLLEVYHKIGEFLDKGLQTDVIYLDFTKTVYHTHCLSISWRKLDLMLTYQIG